MINIINTDIYHRFKDKIDIKIIYIKEAHAVDVWPIGLSAGVLNYEHKTIYDRIACAKKLIKSHNIQIPMYVDKIQNSLLKTFTAWPFRIIICKDYRIKYISHIRENAEYDICELYDYIHSIY